MTIEDRKSALKAIHHMALSLNPIDWEVEENHFEAELNALLEQVAKEQREKAIKDCKNAFCLGYHEDQDVWEWDEEPIQRIDNHLEKINEGKQ